MDRSTSKTEGRRTTGYGRWMSKGGLSSIVYSLSSMVYRPPSLSPLADDDIQILHLSSAHNTQGHRRAGPVTAQQNL